MGTRAFNNSWLTCAMACGDRTRRAPGGGPGGAAPAPPSLRSVLPAPFCLLLGGSCFVRAAIVATRMDAALEGGVWLGECATWLVEPELDRPGGRSGTLMLVSMAGCLIDRCVAVPSGLSETAEAQASPLAQCITAEYSESCDIISRARTTPCPDLQYKFPNQPRQMRAEGDEQ